MNNNKIIFKKYEGYLLKKEKNNNLDELPISKLYKKSKYISQFFIYRIIQKLNKEKITLNNKFMSIFLDCSVFIKPYKKIINMLILCAMTMTLHSLNIPYSIGLFGDEEFKVIVKQYEEDHSIFILQQAYECLMLNRYRSNLSSVLNFAKCNEFLNNKNDNYKDRIFYFITDGLDEELSLIKEWKNIIKNNDDINFGFIFNIPDIVKKIIKNNFKKIKYNNLFENNKIEEEDIFLFEKQKQTEIYNDSEDEDDEEDKIDEKDLELLLKMWINFEKLNKINNLKTTLINVKNHMIDNSSIDKLSKNFAELLCQNKQIEKKIYILMNLIIINLKFLKYH